MAPPRPGHIGNSGREDTLLASELFIDKVCNAVGCQAQITLGHDITLPPQVLPLDDIPQTETDIKTAIGQTGNAACHERVCGLLAPQPHIRAAGFIQYSPCSVDGPELPAALQIGLDDGADFLG